jgi:hypothetical protein
MIAKELEEEMNARLADHLATSPCFTAGEFDAALMFVVGQVAMEQASILRAIGGTNAQVQEQQQDYYKCAKEWLERRMSLFMRQCLEPFAPSMALH